MRKIHLFVASQPRTGPRRALVHTNIALEERVVFNATASLDVVPALVAELPTSPAPTESPAVTVGHFPGCGCGECLKLVTTAEDGTEQVAYALPPIMGRSNEQPAAGEFAPPYPGQTFTLHSRPTSPRKIFLDFDGHTTSGTGWNTSYNGGNPFTSSAFNFEGSNTTFSTNEEERIQRIWQRVMEDYSPFDVDVTTEDPGLSGLTYSGASDTTWGMRVVISPDDGWIRDDVGGIGGIAYVPSFRSSIDITCHVFSGNLGPNDEKYIAEAISHEVGHTLGLGHDGTATQGYYGGHSGSGTPGWAPIMGVGYYQPLSQWSRGEYPGANNTQDDLAIITNTTNNFGYRPDDAGNTIATATAATTSGTTLTAAGVIERTTDVDVYSFLTGPGNVSFNFDPWVNSPNLDIRAELRNSAGTILASSDPLNVLTASIATNITTAGTYYLFVEGVGVGNEGTTGYSDYASLGQYTINGTIVAFYRLDGLETTVLNYTENQAPVALTSTLLVNPGVNLNQATVTIQNYVNGQDVLNFTNQNGITGNFNTATGVLTLSGTATPAQYQTALRSVTYSNPSQDPSTIARQLQFQVRDVASVMSNMVSRTLNIISVNDQPTLAAITDRNVTEDAGPQSVNLTGISTGGEAQTLTITATSNNPSVIPNPSITYTSPNATGILVFTPAPNAYGQATITVTVRDNGGTANGGVNQRVRTFVVTVNPDANDAPVLDASGMPAFTAIPKNTSNPTGDPLTLIIDESISDPDPNPLEGIAVVGLTGTANGTWQYSLNGGTTWTDFGSVDVSTARLLRPDDMMRFVPNPNYVGVVQVTYHAWDQYTGTAGGTADLSTATGGATAFSTAIESASFYVAMGLTPALEDSKVNPGDSSKALLNTFVTDADPNPKKGMAITQLSGPTAGVWQYSANGKAWVTIGNVSRSRALLLRETDKLRFVAAADQYGYATVRYHAWDQTMGTRGTYVDLTPTNAVGGNTAFSAGDMIAFAETTPVNDRPILDKGGNTVLTSVAPNDLNPAGDSVANLVRHTVVDLDANALRGIAIIGIGKKLAGTWQFSTDAGTSWTNFPVVTAKAALMLRPEDMVRFIPGPGVTGQTNFVYKAWDQTTGNAGTTSDTTLRTVTAFSVATETALLNIGTANVPNAAPVLSTTLTPVLPNIVEDTKPKGHQVSHLLFLGAAVTDSNFDSQKGIAITGLTGQNTGRWEWSVNGVAWRTIPTVTQATAFLLRNSDWFRYVPGVNSTAGASITYHAWDQSRGTAGNRADLSGVNGTGGTAPFSTASKTIPVAITPVNDAPKLYTGGNPVLPPPAGVNPPGVTVGSFANSLITDPDAGAAKGIAITKSASAFGTWEYSLDAGATWELVPIFPPLNDQSALLLRDTDLIRMNPFNTPTGTAFFNFKAWDQSVGTAGSLASTLGSSTFGKTFETVRMSMNNGNNRPMLDTTPAPMIAYPTGSTVAALVGTTVTDTDVLDALGIAVTFANSTPKTGTWKFSLDGGASWSNIDKVSANNALLLRATDMIRFEPASGYYGTQKLLYKAWDQTTGVAGQRSKTNLNAFSTNSESAVVNVNAAPVLVI